MKALSFCARAARQMLKALSSARAKKYFRESAFLPAVSLTRHQRGAQTRITTSELRDEQRAQHTSRRTQWGIECQLTNCVIAFAARPS
jgi:hypothetical protein